jgi:F-type H+-transporting ATPase subunit c
VIHQEYTMENVALAYLAAGFGAGLSVLGAGLGIGRLAASAMEGSARQPTALGEIRTTMIIAAALIEGVALFAVVVCMLLALKA